jgi:molybdopterin-guanine dinucleotide biosynthesis protein A
MGRDKALLPLAGKPVIQHVLDRIEGLAGEILITAPSTEAYESFGARVVPDQLPHAGALMGLLTALDAACGDPVLALACDMPFVQRPLLEHLLSLADRAQVIIPYRAGEFEPFPAVYSRTCLPAIRAALLAGKRRMISFFPDVRVHKVDEDTLARLDPEGRTFFNVNTPADFAEAERLLHAG